jgi:hypothetical protein
MLTFERVKSRHCSTRRAFDRNSDIKSWVRFVKVSTKLFYFYITAKSINRGDESA